MSEDTQQQAIDKKIEEDKWIKEQTGLVLNYCSRKDLKISGFNSKKSAVLPPAIAVWYMESRTGKENYWVISGDVPTDHIPLSVADNPRDAIRHFSLTWQLKAENLLAGLADDKAKLGDSEKQREFANLLITSSENIYSLAMNDKFWVNSPS